jgi:hypothetical protein
MGSSKSKKFGGMLLTLVRPYYYTGDEVNGGLNLNLKEKTSLSNIEIDLSVIEYTSFPDSDFKPNEGMVNLNRDSNNHHCRNDALREGRKTILKNFGLINTTNLNKGQYLFPFYFTIPVNLPGSFEYYDKDKTAYIIYVITARLVITNHPEDDLFYDNIFFVRQSPQYFEYPPRLSTSKNMYCLCFDKGVSTFHLSFTKHFFSPDETLQIICELDNTKCSLMAKSIKLELFQKIILKDNQMNTCSITRKMSEKNYQGNYVKILFILIL